MPEIGQREGGGGRGAGLRGRRGCHSPPAPLGDSEEKLSFYVRVCVCACIRVCVLIKGRYCVIIAHSRSIRQKTTHSETHVGPAASFVNIHKNIIHFNSTICI